MRIMRTRRCQKEINEYHLRSAINDLEKSPDFRKGLIRNPGKPISLIVEVKPKAPGRINVEKLEIETVVNALKKVVNGKRLFMSTTNGTKSLQKVRNAKHLFAMGLPNRKAVAEKIISLKSENVLIDTLLITLECDNI